MKYYICTDIEGVAGLQSKPDFNGENKMHGMALLTDEVNACVQGIFDADPDAVVTAWDGHGSGAVISERLDSRATYARDGGFVGTLDGTYDALLFVGQHAMAGTYNAPLAHTYSSKNIAYFKINGYFMGEFGVRTCLAGDLGVPAVMLSGDDKACLEAQSIIPNILLAEVKKGYGLDRAVSVSHDVACDIIRRCAQDAVGAVGTIAPCTLEPPYLFEVRFLNPTPLEDRHPEAIKIDEYTWQFRADRLMDIPFCH